MPASGGTSKIEAVTLPPVLPERPPAPLFSPGGFLVLVVVMAVEAVVVYLLAGLVLRPAGSVAADALGQTFVEVDLGPYVRDLPPADALGATPDRFVLRTSLVLNPRFENLAEVRAMVETRKNLLKHIVSTDILHRLSEADLRKPAILDLLAAEIRRRVNVELPSGKPGVDVVERVIFPESKLPLGR